MSLYQSGKLSRSSASAMWDFEIDPDGDITIVLRNPNAALIEKPTAANSVFDQAREQEVLFEPRPEPEPEPAVPYESSPALEPEPDISVLPGQDDDPEAVELPIPPSSPPSVIEENNVPPPRTEVRFRVSSKHLTLASSTFRSMLNGQWAEANRHEIAAEDWDTEAMCILLLVIHGRNQRVPKNVSLELLTNIAILVDYYDCREAMDSAAAIWIKGLDLQPEETSRDLVFWLFIAWAFRRDDIFTDVTTTAVLRGEEQLRTWNLPIPESITELIERLRCEFMSDLMASLTKLCSELLEGEVGCSAECSSMLLGTLLRELKMRGLEAQPVGISFSSAVESLQCIQSPLWINFNPFGSSFHVDDCDLKSIVKGRIAWRNIKGFGIADANKSWRVLKEEILARAGMVWC
ncbi:uncharacterized protein PpBr36_09923 [Pyricularia pennisetigena]|uniref:uncharacterized protein n=1 Tax=Pyricularia pennisetigena TaxID=1578925 RepID=UPI00115305F3|nr:uncharacterized protein PpBr36_09923 [Pyricularia pennisetigena]TLS22376.1 hypothetical protein PpBr36_09923 [Pyricularia pennisetigena]